MDYGGALVGDAYRAKGQAATALEIEERAARMVGYSPGKVLSLIALGRREEAEGYLRELETSYAAGSTSRPS